MKQRYAERNSNSKWKLQSGFDRTERWESQLKERKLNCESFWERQLKTMNDHAMGVFMGGGLDPPEG